jgi:hypothetical protein
MSEIVPSALDESLTKQAVENRRTSVQAVRSVIFGVSALYGLSTSSVAMPLGAGETFDSGQICLTTDADAPAQSNIGVIDYAARKLKIRYAVQAVFPGLYSLVMAGRFDPSLLNPIRAVATDECAMTRDLRGWRALGCLEFLPGSLWAGAHGG